MNTELRNKLRILVVEDKLPTANAVRLEFQTHFPGAEIELARTVEAALLKLDESCSTGNLYAAAVLDFRLPARTIGDVPENDFSISRQFNALSRETILVHMTAFPDDPEIKRFLRNQPTFEESGHLFVAKQ